ncbi:MAG: cell division protein ZapE [Pseudomonadota bacterium]
MSAALIQAAEETGASNPLEAYCALVDDGLVQFDPEQEQAARELLRLHNQLVDYRPAPKVTGWRARFFKEEKVEAPCGLYIHGGVGRGKSMLMDLFFATAPVAAKRRVHFNAFMLEIHERLHRWRKSVSSDFDRKRGRHMDDPIPPIARDLAAQAWLLCFDEFHVVDIADAMILGRLFTALFDEGVVVVTTSNWAPDDLYKDGLQRDRFVPFIELLKQRLNVLHLDSGVDYRLQRIIGAKTYYYPLGPKTDAALAKLFADLTDDLPAKPRTLAVKSRSLTVPKAAVGVAWTNFDDLCGKPLGAADYLVLAENFDTVFVTGVPCLTERKRNEAKRFIVLVDSLYESKTRLIVSAEAAPQQLYGAESHKLEFDRTVSRLIEMQSKDYLARH